MAWSRIKTKLHFLLMLKSPWNLRKHTHAYVFYDVQSCLFRFYVEVCCSINSKLPWKSWRAHNQLLTYYFPFKHLVNLVNSIYFGNCLLKSSEWCHVTLISNVFLLFFSASLDVSYYCWNRPCFNIHEAHFLYSPLKYLVFSYQNWYCKYILVIARGKYKYRNRYLQHVLNHIFTSIGSYLLYSMCEIANVER